MKFLVAVDDSEGSLHALTWALDHIVRLGVSDTAEQPAGNLILLHVQESVYFLIPPVGPAAPVYPPIMVTESVKKSQDENSERLLSRAKEICLEREASFCSMWRLRRNTGRRQDGCRLVRPLSGRSSRVEAPAPHYYERLLGPEPGYNWETNHSWKNLHKSKKITYENMKEQDTS